MRPKMPAKKKYDSEIIARWRRRDGYELHLRRDGRAFFWVPSQQKYHPAIECTTIDLIEKWRFDQGIGFERI